MVAFPPASSPNGLNAPGLLATPLAHRSLSAPSHLQLSTLGQGALPSYHPMTNKNYNSNIAQIEYGTHQHQQYQSQQQQLQQNLNAQFPATPIQQAYDQQQYLVQSQLHMSMQPQPIASNAGNNYYGQQPIHPFQMDLIHTSLNQTEMPSSAHVKFELPIDSTPRQRGNAHQAFNSQDMDDIQTSTGPPTYSPSSSSMDSASPTFSGDATAGTHSSALRQVGGVISMPYSESEFAQFELPEEFAGYNFPRHGSLGSLYPITQSHELLDATSPFGSAAHHHYHFHSHRRYETGGTEMIPSSSSTSISSVSSLPPSNSGAILNSTIPSLNSSAPGAKAKQRRASLSPDTPSRVFHCMADDCGKLFKRSEHLKRHVRSVHTLEKPFICPYKDCPKSFSRSDNLNQHIRVHRHDKEKTAAAGVTMAFTNFTPLIGPSE
ncbi:hypothetical protein FBU30_001776 [Linnemannia zychae]|nr:hypothetical protein FBU30_001776 [Linnemannia zychae]